MKVKDLIAFLLSIDPNLECCTQDESGTWCTTDNPAVFNTSDQIRHYPWFDLKEETPREPFYEEFVAL